MGWLFWLEIRRRWSADHDAARFVFGLVCVFLFFSYQLQSIVFTAALGFPLVQAFAPVAVICVLNALKTVREEERVG